MDKSMKVLFIIFHGFQEYNGISKKIRYQIRALKECGMDVSTCHYDVSSEGHRQWLINDEIIADLGTGIQAKIKKRIDFTAIKRYAIENKIDWVYIRYYHNANPFTIHLVKKLKENGIKIVVEIPTYPYDHEFSNSARKIYLYIDKLFRYSFCKYIDAIITFSNDTKIFGQRTIRISNGIDFSNIPLRKNIHDLSKEIHLIGVAEIHFWHGFDRLIQGLGLYYKENPEYKVYFHLVGNIAGKREKDEIINSIQKYKIAPYVILHGAKHGEELNELFNHADFAIGSLGRHRSGIFNIKTLKNREYAARGFAFIYSETDDDFDYMPYILKAPANESPINILQIINYCHSQSIPPEEIRKSIKHLSWKEQMKKVCKDKIFQEDSKL